MSERIFIGVAWPYANGSLHLGTIAGANRPMYSIGVLTWLKNEKNATGEVSGFSIEKPDVRA